MNQNPINKRSDRRKTFAAPPKSAPIPRGAHHYQIGRGLFVLTTSRSKADEMAKLIEENRNMEIRKWNSGYKKKAKDE